MSRSSTASPSRCRACGAPLVGGRHGRACPRCHPEEAAIASQLELSLNAAELPHVPTPAPARAAETMAEKPPPPPAGGAPAVGWEPARPSRTPGYYLTVAASVLIVAGGVAWAGFHLWPRGPVEQALVQAIAALPHFVERTGAANPLGLLAVDGDSSPAFADIDGDGLLDLVTGSRNGHLHIVRNTGSRLRPRFIQPAGDPFGLAPTDTSNVIAFADLRGVHVPDAVNAGTNGALTFFENRGTSQHPDFVLLAPEDDPFAVTVTPRQSYDWRPAFADLDHDRDLDLIVGTRDGTVLYFENRGTPRKPQFRGVTQLSPFGLRGLGELVSISFGDVDGDGDLDAVSGDAAGTLRYLENRGNAWRPQFALSEPGTLGLGAASPETTVALADLDGDGDLDCITGGADGRFRYFENVSEPVRSR